MVAHREPPQDDLGEETYFATESDRDRVFDASVLRESVSTLPARRPITLKASDTASQAMRAMQRGHRGCVLVTDDGSLQSRLAGIFTERDVLHRIIEGGRNPATLPLGEVMTPDPECLPSEATIAWALNKMSVGGFRHVPVIDDRGRPVFVASVRDVVDFLVQAFPREILNLPTDFGADRPRTREGA